MRKIRYDLIEKELSLIPCEEYHKLKLTNKFIDNIRNHYICYEMLEKFYDSEPDINEEEFKMYMDYKYNESIYSIQSHTIKELKSAYHSVMQKYRYYENQRLEFNNWIEVYGEGIWDMSQKQVDSIAINTLKELQKINVPRRDRFYIYKHEDCINVYFYGRDFMYKDYWFVFKRK